MYYGRITDPDAVATLTKRGYDRLGKGLDRRHSNRIICSADGQRRIANGAFATYSSARDSVNTQPSHMKHRTRCESTRPKTQVRGHVTCNRKYFGWANKVASVPSLDHSPER